MATDLVANERSATTATVAWPRAVARGHATDLPTLAAGLARFSNGARAADRSRLPEPSNGTDGVPDRYLAVRAAIVASETDVVGYGVRCEHLSLTNFRNYARLEMDVPGETVILQGDNAQGKTNFLEAIHVLATTRSPRAASDREFINWLAFKEALPFARVVARVRKETGHILQIELTAAVREADSGIAKRFRVNGAPKRSIDVIGLATVVLFSPLDIDLVAGSPSQRRRYLDIMNSQVDSRYLRSLQQYNKVLTQRNSLLRLIRDGQARADQLAYWDLQLGELGSYIVDKRRNAIAFLDRLARQIHPDLTGRQEQLGTRYAVNVLNGNLDDVLPPADALPELFASRLREMQPREIAQGISLVGPHRDDLHLTTDGADTATYGSRGQQRTAALTLKLAEAELIQSETGEKPILLLDDVMSELDQRRRHAVLASIRPGQQVILTTTDLDDFEASFLERASLFRVKGGRVERIR